MIVTAFQRRDASHAALAAALCRFVSQCLAAAVEILSAGAASDGIQPGDTGHRQVGVRVIAVPDLPPMTSRQTRSLT